MRLGVLALALAGCNQVFSLDGTDVRVLDADTRPDLDQDGIADVEDPCISPAEDASSDVDMDGILDRDDRCPFSGPAPTDGDSDGVPDLCDPFPMSGGDRHRCTMTFQSRTLNAALWPLRPRNPPPKSSLELLPLTGLIVIFGSGEGVATADVLGTAATTMVEVPIGVAYAPENFTVGLLLGAQPTPGPSDVACEMTNRAGVVRVSFVGTTTAQSATGLPPKVFPNDTTQAAGFALRAYLQPGHGGPNVTCVLIYEDVNSVARALTARGHIDMPIGRFGLYGTDGFYSFYGVGVFERDDTPPLP